MITIPVSIEVRDWADNAKTEQQAPYTNLTPYIALGGLKWSRNDVEASDAERTQDSKMHRDRVGIKIRLDCKCRPLTTDETHIVLPAVKPVWLQVRYLDPSDGALRTMKAYSNNIPATFLFMRPNGISYWEGIEFPLIEE